MRKALTIIGISVWGIFVAWIPFALFVALGLSFDNGEGIATWYAFPWIISTAIFWVGSARLMVVWNKKRSRYPL